jgi:hypothetical protein
MLRKFFMAAIAIQFFFAASSQETSLAVISKNDLLPEEKIPEPDKTPALMISGSADMYYRYDLAETKANNFTSFTNSHNNFALGMASIKLEHKTTKVDMVADLGFGNRVAEFSYNDDGILAAIKQLYISYSPVDWIKFTAGSWATHIGYELLDPQLNRNYSMSYMFTNGPFSHTGIKADITKGKHGFMIGIANPTDYRFVPEGVINKKFVLAQYSLAATDAVHLYLNYAGGKSPDTSKSKQLDIVVSNKFNDKFSISYNGTIINVQQWDGIKNMDGKSAWGSALYLNVDPKEWWGFTLRGEYFSDKNQLKTFSGATEGGSIFATTLSANFKVDNFIFIPEFRIDKANKEIFTGKNGNGVKSAANVLLAAIYSF